MLIINKGEENIVLENVSTLSVLLIRYNVVFRRLMKIITKMKNFIESPKILFFFGVVHVPLTNLILSSIIRLQYIKGVYKK